MSSRVRTLVITLSTLIVAILLMGAVLARNATNEGAYRQLGVYTDVLQRIKSDYVEEPDLKSVTLGAINGLLESVDPFASYLNADQYKEYLKNKDAYKGSVGLILSKRFGYVGVVDAIPGSPAAKAGLTTGDMIESIRGIATRDMPLAYANLLLEGKPGTPIEISVLAMRHPEPKKTTLTRAVVQYPRATEKLMDGGVGYIQVQALVSGTVGEVASAVKSLEKQGAKKLLLDLRYCGTGTPEEGIALANLFKDNGLVTYVQGQRYQRRDFQADPAKAVTKLPLVVLTNRGTAGGSEIAAAALLDSKRAEVVGERSYGDAAIRQAITMDDGGAIILSVAKYYSPSGKAIQDVGVTPTVRVAEAEPVIDPEDDNEPDVAPAPEKPGEDPILKKGLEVITKGVPPEAAAQPAAPRPEGPAKPDIPPNVMQPEPDKK
jgi:carboxyl-terminal processing protease